MPFVKLDTGILHSTLWVERECREIFITALLMAEPIEITTPAQQIEINSTEYTGWEVPAGWYGMVHAASTGIIRMAMIDIGVGLAALDRLGTPDPQSRSSDFEGRRLVRVNGGFIVLNFMKYRDRDYTSADRSRRYRERQRAIQESRCKAPSHRSVTASHRNITQAEAEAEVPPYSPPFVDFWDAWPRSERKQSKGKCFELWRKLRLDQHHGAIIAHVKSMIDSDTWHNGYIPAPLVYLNQRRWEGAEIRAKPEKRQWVV